MEVLKLGKYKKKQKFSIFCSKYCQEFFIFSDKQNLSVKVKTALLYFVIF